MPIQYELVEIVPRGLEQKTDARMKTPGSLAAAGNVEFNRIGRLNKRRGYRRISLTAEALGGTVADPGNLFLRVGNRGGELVICALDNLWSVVSPTASVDGAALRDKGPLPRGHTIRRVISTAPLSDGS